MMNHEDWNRETPRTPSRQDPQPPSIIFGLLKFGGALLLVVMVLGTAVNIANHGVGDALTELTAVGATAIVIAGLLAIRWGGRDNHD